MLENIEDLADSEVKKTREELENFKTFARRQAIPKLIEEASFWGERNEKLSVEDAVKTILGDARDTNYTFSSSEKEKLIKANRNVGLEVPRELKE
ncbi:MAG: hypothetical protein NZO16_00070 [Deltaproteobacteria bacterium]|nr:hypothetical protein [Deltaproteobacteria bacterium]